LQQAGAIGAYSAALFVIGAALTDRLRSIARSVGGRHAG
jgi:hypothetical protein